MEQTETQKKFEQAVREMAVEMTRIEIKAEVDAIMSRIIDEQTAKMYAKS